MVIKISKNRIDIGNEQLQNVELNSYSKTVTTADSTTAYALNFSLGNVFNITLTANCTFTFTNPPTAGKAGTLFLTLKQDTVGSRTATWPITVLWAGGIAPTLATAPSVGSDFLQFNTLDGGATWYGEKVTAGFLLTGRTLWAWGDNALGRLGHSNVILRSSPTQVGTLTTWSSIRGGGTHTLALRNDST